MVSRSGGQTIEARIVVKDQKTRLEMPQMILIQRGDLNVSWMIMVEQRMYSEQAFDPKVLAQTDKRVAGEMEREGLGKDPVNGQSADKFKVTYSVQGQTQSVFQWIGSQGVPLKVEAVDGSWSVEYRNVKMGGIDDSLFEVPADYQKLAVPSMSQLVKTLPTPGDMNE